jgi:hypothetical protein
VNRQVVAIRGRGTIRLPATSGETAAAQPTQPAATGPRPFELLQFRDAFFLFGESS